MIASKALVTASAGGIGLAVSRRLRAAGYDVIMSDLDEEAGKREAAAIGARFRRCDMRDPPQIAELVEWAGAVRLLVNNAGIAGPTLPVAEYPVEDWKEVFDVNVTAQFVACRHMVPKMIAAGGGIIVNMASVAARIGYPNRSAYAASKWAVLGLTASLAREVGTAGIRVNAILPGSVRGARIERVIGAYAEANGMDLESATAHYLSRQATRRLVEPDEIAETILFLASDNARSITGQFIGVDGGFE